VALMALFIFETLTGFALFFAMGLIPGIEPLGLIHSALGLVLIPIFIFYQIRHYSRVRHLKNNFHYKLGLATSLSLLIVIISGLPLLPNMSPELVANKAVTLIHVVSSFAFLICLAGHLTIVWRLTIGRSFRGSINGDSQ
jgi:hypothetical protein